MDSGLEYVGPTGNFAKPRRNVGMTPKYLTLLSTLRSSVSKLYANKRIRDICHVNNRGSDENSFRRAMSSLMLMAQCFALCPVQGITSLNAHDVRFTWCSWRVGYCIVMILGMAAACVFTIAFYIKGFFNFETSAIVVLYTLGLSCCSCFMSLARRWPRLEELWQRTEHEQIQYGYPKNLYLRIRIMSAVILAIALGEHFLAKYTVICAVALCSDKKTDLLQLYWLMHYRFVFQFVQFSLPLAFLCEIVNFFASFYWNFMDLFIIVLSMALSSRFRLLNSHLKVPVGKVQPETFWRNARVSYNSLSVLTKFLDSCISSIVLLSFATNMFYICQQLYNTLRKSIGTVKLVYFFVSISYLLFRTVALSLCAASIHEESRATKDILYALPAESYTIEGCMKNTMVTFLISLSIVSSIHVFLLILNMLYNFRYIGFWFRFPQIMLPSLASDSLPLTETCSLNHHGSCFFVHMSPDLRTKLMSEEPHWKIFVTWVLTGAMYHWPFSPAIYFSNLKVEPDVSSKLS